jgi:RNA polymerase sigma-70 factor (ECF subfamily)
VIDLGKFRQGESGYFEELMREHGPRALSIAMQFAEDRDHAEDLFQEIWRRTFAKRRSFRPTGSFSAWFSRLATNVCIGDFRVRRRWSDGVSQLAQQGRAEGLREGSLDPLALLERSERIVQLREGLALLSAREYEAIRLRVLEEKSTAEVAQIMEVEEATVRSTIRHGIRRLRRIMEAGEDELSGYESSH